MKKNSCAKRRSSILLFAISIAILLLTFQQVFTVPITIGDHAKTRANGNANAKVKTKENSSIDSGHGKVGNEDTGNTDHDPEQYYRDLLPPRRNDNNSTFSACLLVADDNHYLIEWLAYHYLSLPLTYLVIASDPRARTTPDLILDRWSQYMTIVRWNDQNFLPKKWLNRIPDENDPVAKLIKHRERQRHFYPSCFRFLKQAGRQWVMVIDVDEFAMQNTHYENITRVYPTFHQAVHEQFLTNTTCISMPRLRFGNYEDNNSSAKKLTPPGFQDVHFLTCRFRWRAGLLSRQHNKLPKSMIHVGKIANFSREDTDAHRPVRSECPRRNLYTLHKDSPFVVHHYVGSDQQFRFRKDARDGTKTRSDQQLNNYNQIKEDYDESACSWISSFKERLGTSTAQALLEGVGDVNYTPIMPDQNLSEVSTAVSA